MKRDTLRIKQAKLTKLNLATRRAVELIVAKVLSKVWTCETTCKLDASGERLVLIHKPQGKRNVILTFDLI